MNVSLQWLSSFFEEPLPEQAPLLDALTFGGIEVEAVHSRGVQLPKVVVAQVSSREQHPDADRLSVCQVDDGSGQLRQIVCGAKNFQEGDKVPLALPGAVLPGDFKIKVGKLRGVKSEGMMCSGRELGLSADADGLLILDASAPVGVELSELFPPETTIEIEVTPNRPDLLSHYGVARDLAALQSLKLKALTIEKTKEKKGLAGPTLHLEAEERCPFYLGRTIEGVKVQASPDWLKKRLEAIGLRPINNVVDITNYVLHELGQPLHAFDVAQVSQTLHIRMAKAEEKILALNGEEIELSNDDLVIADAKKVLAIAGIMGGEESGVVETTTNIYLEAAYFQPSGIRRSSRRLGLSSDSSYRFERGVDPQGVAVAMERATQLVLELAGGQASAVVKAEAPQANELLKEKIIELRHARCRSLLGMPSLTAAEIIAALTRLGLALQQNDEASSTWNVPTRYRDLTREVDLIEEVVRVLGLGNVEKSSRVTIMQPSPADAQERSRRALSERLAGLGAFETKSHLMIAPEALKQEIFAEGQSTLAVKNPMNEEQVIMRPGMVSGLLAAAERNARFGAKSLRLFELGPVFAATGESTSRLGLLVAGQTGQLSWRSPSSRALDWFDLKALLEQALGCPVLAAANDASAWPVLLTLNINKKTPLGFASKAPSRLADELGFRDGIWVAEIDLMSWEKWSKNASALAHGLPKYPAVSRDVALVGSLQVSHSRVEAELNNHAPDILESVTLFDVFHDPTGTKLNANQRSLAYQLVYRAPDRTLNDKEVVEAHEALVKHVCESLGLSLRV